MASTISTRPIRTTAATARYSWAGPCRTAIGSASSWRPRCRAWLVKDCRRLRPLPRRAVGAAPDLVDRLLPAARPARRTLANRARSRRSRMGRAQDRRGQDRAPGLLVPRQLRGVQPDSRRVRRLGHVPDPVQLHGRAAPGGRPRAASRRRKGTGGRGDGAVARRPARRPAAGERPGAVGVRARPAHAGRLGVPVAVGSAGGVRCPQRHEHDGSRWRRTSRAPSGQGWRR